MLLRIKVSRRHYQMEQDMLEGLSIAHWTYCFLALVLSLPSKRSLSLSRALACLDRMTSSSLSRSLRIWQRQPASTDGCRRTSPVSHLDTFHIKTIRSGASIGIGGAGR